MSQKMKIDPRYIAGPWMTEHEIKIVEDCMRNGWYSYEYVETFQKEFAKYHNRKFGIMTPNCTHAIHLLLTAMGIKEGDEVIVPDCTWVATAAPIVYLGATPVFCDIEKDSWCLDPVSVRECITERTKAIMVVDLFGNMPNMDEIQKISKEYNIPLIEDSAEALGSKYKGNRAGSFGIGSVFSFHRTKTLVTGEGGMLVLDDENLYDRCMFLRDHGRKPSGPAYYFYEITYKYMPSNLQAALGYAQFQRLDELIKKKRDIFARYKSNLSHLEDFQFNAEPDDVFNSVWITSIVFGRKYGLDKMTIMERLEQLGIPTRPFFYPLSYLPAFPGARDIYEKRNPIAYDISNRGINLPSALVLTNEQIDLASEAVVEIVKKVG